MCYIYLSSKQGLATSSPRVHYKHAMLKAIRQEMQSSWSWDFRHKHSYHNLHKCFVSGRWEQTYLILSNLGLTWIGGDDECGVVEEAVPWVPSSGLVVEIHGNGSMGHEVIWVEAWEAPLQHAAVHLRADVVDVFKQRCVVRRRFRHTPSFLQQSNHVCYDFHVSFM